jgi:hypothetical protein
VNVGAIQEAIRSSLCADVKVIEQEDGLLLVSTPFAFSDGDAYSIYLQGLQTGGLRITDLGGTLMHLSYENNIGKLREGTRGKVFRQIVSELDLQEDDGEFFIDSPADRLGANIFHFGQAITRFHDLSFLNRIRVESTFYDDLGEKLAKHVDRSSIREHHLVPGLEDAANYPVDFLVERGARPLYLFGVPTREKAMLTTIILQHLNAADLDFVSMVVFQNSADIPAKDLSRLMNAANDMVSSLEATKSSGGNCGCFAKRNSLGPATCQGTR